VATATINQSASVIGKTFRRTVSASADGAVYKDPQLTAAKTGVLTTRTDDNTGTFTMDSGHGIASTNRVDVYWDGGSRYGMTATVTGDSVVLDGGGGDVLPAADTDITAMKPQLESFAVTAADLQSLLCGTSANGTQMWAVFREADTTLVAAVQVTADGDYIWEDTNGADNPFGADVADVYLSHGDSAATRTVNAVALVN
jgi:hypothetical protein